MTRALVGYDVVLGAEAASPESDVPRLVEEVAEATSTQRLSTPGGRAIEVSSEGDVDHVTLRARGGEILLRFSVDEDGPVFRVEGARVEIAATKSLALEAETVAIVAEGELAVRSGSLRTVVEGDRDTQVRGAERLEVGTAEIQASEGHYEVRASGRIALDGEHIGLNDDPCLEPFSWSEAFDE